MTWHTYEVPPIDFGWNNLRTVRETVNSLAARMQSEFLENDIDPSEVQHFLANWESAKAEASAAGWEGDLRHEPVVFWIPDDTEFSYGFILKQDNNGTTYVVSPVPLPWLESAY